MTLYEDLKWRGIIQDISSPELEKKLNEGGLTFYIGTDPTAESLHFGHYSSFHITKRLAKAGHTPILLVGGATALIGDPRGTGERKLADKEAILKNFDKLKAQIQKIFPYEVVNNYDWIKDINVLDFLRDYGKNISVNYLLSKDLIKKQLEVGISYAEFSYNILQGLDFKHLYETKNVTLQVGGSDQWGNITTGIELIRKTLGKEVYAFTMPLVTDSHGKKFGKSEGNALWLDKEKTSPYELYQFLLNSEDCMIITYLKRFTFLSKEEIEDIEKKHFENPNLRIAQKALAKEVICDLHGEEEYNKAVYISEKLFEGDIKKIQPKDLIIALKGVPNFTFELGTNIVDLLVNAKICSSKREAREMLSSNAISLNGDIINEDKGNITKEDTLDGNTIVIRKGKKKFFIGNLI